MITMNITTTVKSHHILEMSMVEECQDILNRIIHACHMDNFTISVTTIIFYKTVLFMSLDTEKDNYQSNAYVAKYCYVNRYLHK